MAVGTVLYNIVPTAVGIIPVTRVDPTKDQLSPEWLADSPLGKKKTKNNPIPTSASIEMTNAASSSTGANADSPISEKTSAHPTGPHGSRLLEQDLYEGGIGTKKSYDPDVMAGLPVGVQIVGKLF